MSHIDELIIQEVEQELVNRVPSSAAVYNALLKKVEVDGSNTFTAANYFPDVDIENVPDSQLQLVVNVRSLRQYIISIFNQVADTVISLLPSFTYTKRYEFLVASDVWTINHQQNTDRISVSLYQLGTDRQLVAPYYVINNMSLQVLFSTPESGYADIKFY